MGGPSSEREVSLRTGRGIATALKSKGFAVESFDVQPGPALGQLSWSAPPDIVFIALHGPFGEDGTLQGFLDSLQIPYVGSGVGASALSMHKGLAKKHLEQFGVPLAKSFDFEGESGLEKFLRQHASENFLAKKWFIKPAREGSTIGIERYDPSAGTRGRSDFEKLCRSALRYDSYLLVEEWIEGAEITIPVLFGQAMPVVEIRPLSHFYDFQSKYTAGKTEYLCPAPLDAALTEKVQRLSEDVYRYLECEDYGRVDMMLGPQGPIVLEMNTLPGMTETSLVPKSAKVAGLSYEDFVEKLVKGSYEKQMGMGRKT